VEKAARDATKAAGGDGEKKEKRAADADEKESKAAKKARLEVLKHKK
jgi:hypothetical protein